LGVGVAEDVAPLALLFHQFGSVMVHAELEPKRRLIAAATQ